jgi:hypothetical protein
MRAIMNEPAMPGFRSVGRVDASQPQEVATQAAVATNSQQRRFEATAAERHRRTCDTADCIDRMLPAPEPLDQGTLYEPMEHNQRVIESSILAGISSPAILRLPG